MDKDEWDLEIVDKSTVSPAAIQQTLAEAWDEMRKPGTAAHQAALDAGIDVDKLPLRFEDAVEVRPDGAGAASVELIVAGLLAKMAHDAWKDVWKGILFPKLKRRFGETAVRVRKRNPKATTDAK